MPRVPVPLDPAVDAAALLRRLGFAALFIALPVAALLLRRAPVVILPIGALLLVGAAALDGRSRPFRQVAERLLGSAAFLFTAFGLAWAAVSITWSPAPALSGARFLALAGSLGLIFSAYLVLPERMRSANLYLLPAGVAIAALVALATHSLPAGIAEPEEDGRGLERGLSMLILFAWPAVAWLRSRNRDAAGIGLVLIVTLAALLSPQPLGAAAFAAGAVIYVLTSIGPRIGTLLVVVSGAAILVLAPVAASPLVARALSGGGLPWLGLAADGMRAALDLDPVRLLAGHGYGAHLSARLGGRLSDNALDTPLIQIWYDLGALGPLAAFAAFAAGLRSAVAGQTVLLPGINAAATAGLALASAGSGSMQAWQPIAVGLTVLMSVAVERGQFRTRRPAATLAPSRR